MNITLTKVHTLRSVRTNRGMMWKQTKLIRDITWKDLCFNRRLGFEKLFTDQTISVINTKSCGNNSGQSLIPMNLITDVIIMIRNNFRNAWNLIHCKKFAFQSPCDFILKEPLSKRKLFQMSLLLMMFTTHLASELLLKELKNSSKLCLYGSIVEI